MITYEEIIDAEIGLRGFLEVIKDFQMELDEPTDLLSAAVLGIEQSLQKIGAAKRIYKAVQRGVNEMRISPNQIPWAIHYATRDYDSFIAYLKNSPRLKEKVQWVVR